MGTGGEVWIVNPTACPATTVTSSTPVMLVIPEPKSASACTLIWQEPRVEPGTTSALRLSGDMAVTSAIAGFELDQAANPSIVAGLPCASTGWMDAVTL